MDDNFEFEGFEWDKGNREKNWIKHGVSAPECEQVFLNVPMVLSDESHSQKEDRWYALGRADNGRLLFISFTIRNTHRVRVISARDMSRKERIAYANFEKST